MDLEALDRRRYEDPHSALEEALEVVGLIPFQELPRLLGIIGSFRRILEQHALAFKTITLAIEIADWLDRRELLGDLYQRLAFVVADSGNHQRALKHARHATDLHLEQGDLQAAGKSLVDQGVFLVCLERWRQASFRYLSALRYLPQGDVRHIFAARQGLGTCYLELGELSKASFYADQAWELADGAGTFNKGKLLLLDGRLSAALDRLEEAEEQLTRGIEILMPISSVDAALAGTLLVEVLFRAGKKEEATETATGLSRLIEPLRNNRVAQGAMRELIVKALCGELTAGLASAASRRIAKSVTSTKRPTGRRSVLRPGRSPDPQR